MVAALVTVVPAATARPVPGPDIEPEYDEEFSLGIGYARVVFDGDDTLDDVDAVHFDPVLSFAPLQALPPLRLGAAVGFTVSLDDVGGSVSSGGDDGLVIIGAGDSALLLFEPELRLSWRQPLGSEEVGFFVEPGVAGGGTFAWLDFDDEAVAEAGGSDDPDEWDATFHGRAFLRAGLRVSGGIAGLEAGYLRGGEIDFGGDAGGEVEEFYIGIFGALKF